MRLVFGWLDRRLILEMLGVSQAELRDLMLHSLHATAA